MRGSPTDADFSNASSSCRLAARLVAALLILAACSTPEPPRPTMRPSPEPPPRSVARAGESLCDAASRLGVAVRPLAGANGIDPGRMREPLPEGSELQIPARSRATYRVERGDTLGAIARWSRVGLRRLVADNAIEDPDLVRTGQRLRLAPGARACPSPASFRDAERLIGAAYERYAAADFDGCAQRAERADRLLREGRDTSTRRLQARAAVLEGLAASGNGEDEAAVRAFTRGLSIRPGLRLDPALASPKVEELFERARAASVSGG